MDDLGSGSFAEEVADERDGGQGDGDRQHGEPGEHGNLAIGFVVGVF